MLVQRLQSLECWLFSHFQFDIKYTPWIPNIHSNIFEYADGQKIDPSKYIFQ